MIRNLGDAPGVVPFLAALLRPRGRLRGTRDLLLLTTLRPSRATTDGIKALWKGTQWLSDLVGWHGADDPVSDRVAARRRSNWSGDLGWISRADLILLARTPAFRQGLDQLRAMELDRWALDHLQVVEGQVQAMTPEELEPQLFLSSKDLAAIGIPRGPRWGELLHEAERRQLGGDLPDREAALVWLAQQA